MVMRSFLFSIGSRLVARQSVIRTRARFISALLVGIQRDGQQDLSVSRVANSISLVMPGAMQTNNGGCAVG